MALLSRWAWWGAPSSSGASLAEHTGTGASVHVNSTLSLSPKLGAKIQRFTLVLGRYRRKRIELLSSETTKTKVSKAPLNYIKIRPWTD